MEFNFLLTYDFIKSGFIPEAYFCSHYSKILLMNSHSTVDYEKLVRLLVCLEDSLLLQTLSNGSIEDFQS